MKKIKKLVILDFLAHLAVYGGAFAVVYAVSGGTWWEAYLLFQRAAFQSPMLFAMVFALLSMIAVINDIPKNSFMMLDYVLDVGSIIIPLLSSVVAIFVAFHSGAWYMWIIAIVASIIHLYVKTQSPKRTDEKLAPAPFSFVSIAAIAYVGSYTWLALAYILG